MRFSIAACHTRFVGALSRASRRGLMANDDVTIAVVGSGGDGVVTLGDLVAQVAAREGLYAIKTESYGPQIRGGESSCTVRIAARPISAQGSLVDILVGFGWTDFARFR